LMFRPRTGAHRSTSRPQHHSRRHCYAPNLALYRTELLSCIKSGINYLWPASSMSSVYCPVSTHTRANCVYYGLCLLCVWTDYAQSNPRVLQRFTNTNLPAAFGVKLVKLVNGVLEWR
jgi:hypothetical protein